MSIVTVPTFPYPMFFAGGGNQPETFNNGTLNASGEKLAVILRAPKTGGIRKVGFRINGITSGTDTDVRVEAVSARFPSGSLFGTNTNGTIASGSLVAGAMNMATLTADAAVTVNDLIALVWAPTGSPNLTISTLNSANYGQLPYPAQFDAGVWASPGGVSGAPIAAIEYSDGTYATTLNVFPVSAANVHTFNSTSTPDEIGARFRLPVSQRVRGGWLAVDHDNDFAMVLYDSDGVTPLATSTTMTNDGRVNTSARTPSLFYFPSQPTLLANTYYYLSAKPGASNISVYSWDMLTAAALDQLPGGQDWHYTSAKDPSGTGSWTPILTRYPVMGLLNDGIDNGAAAKPNIFDSGIIRAVPHDSH